MLALEGNGCVQPREPEDDVAVQRQWQIKKEVFFDLAKKVSSVNSAAVEAISAYRVKPRRPLLSRLCQIQEEHRRRHPEVHRDLCPHR
jgi:hypothetical protein